MKLGSTPVRVLLSVLADFFSVQSGAIVCYFHLDSEKPTAMYFGIVY